jgi:hypothetical protein
VENSFHPRADRQTPTIYVKDLIMTTTEEKLKAICAELLQLDESELLSCLPTYHRRLESFSSIREWEEATIIFFLINGLRIKNIQLPDKIKQLNSHIHLIDDKSPDKAREWFQNRPKERPVDKAQDKPVEGQADRLAKDPQLAPKPRAIGLKLVK